MSWNYRVVKEVIDERSFYSIREVYYDKGGRPDGCTENDITPCESTPDELLKALSQMLAAVVSRRVLEIVDGKLVEVDE
jgi:hypothetical protein